jgi:hypothetical protein
MMPNGIVEVLRPTAGPPERLAPNWVGWEGKFAAVEIVAPDRFSARVLLDLVGSLFPVELVGTGDAWIIRLRPPCGSAWQGDLLPLVQRWLETCPLPCATLECGGRRYVFRSALTHTEIKSSSDPPILGTPRISRGAKPVPGRRGRASSAPVGVAQAPVLRTTP